MDEGPTFGPIRPRRGRKAFKTVAIPERTPEQEARDLAEFAAISRLIFDRLARVYRRKLGD